MQYLRIINANDNKTQFLVPICNSIALLLLCSERLCHSIKHDFLLFPTIIQIGISIDRNKGSIILYMVAPFTDLCLIIICFVKRIQSRYRHFCWHLGSISIHDAIRGQTAIKNTYANRHYKIRVSFPHHQNRSRKISFLLDPEGRENFRLIHYSWG